MKVLLLVLFLFTGIFDGGNKGRQANKAYERGDYAKAEEYYRAALKQDPNNPKLLFNLGNTLAKEKKFDQALETYDQYKSLVKKLSDRAKANYNMGNVFADQKKWSQALNMYRRSLLQNPNDPQAKYNYELAYHNQKQQQKKQNQNQNKSNKNNKNSKNKQNQNQNKNNKGNNKNKQNRNNQNNPNKQNQKNKQQQQQQNPNKISKADAQKILNALANKESNILKHFKKAKTQSSKKNAKDW